MRPQLARRPQSTSLDPPSCHAGPRSGIPYTYEVVVVIASCQEDKGPVLCHRRMPSSRDTGPVPGIFSSGDWVLSPTPDVENGYRCLGRSAMTGQGVIRSDVPGSRDGVLSLARKGYGFSPLAGTDLGVPRSFPSDSVASLESVTVRSRFPLPLLT